MDAIAHAHAISLILPRDLAKWPALIKARMKAVPKEHHEVALEYLRSLHTRVLVARREAAKPGSLASRKVAR